MSTPENTAPNKSQRQLIGRLGEDAVARAYTDAGYTIVARNVHEAHNELDLIAADNTHLVFIEVKTRHAVPGARSRFGRPASAIDPAKRARTVAAAEAYLRAHRAEFPGRYPRIDVAEVYVTRRPDGTHEIASIQIFRNAFGAR